MLQGEKSNSIEVYYKYFSKLASKKKTVYYLLTVGNLLLDSHPAFFLPIATTSNKNF
jgi:hypothetical protein